MTHLSDGELIQLFQSGCESEGGEGGSGCEKNGEKARNESDREKAFEILLKRYDFLIRKLTRKYFGFGYEPEDFYQVGAIAFLEAVMKYEENTEYSFYAFALSCVRNGLISEYRKMPMEIQYTTKNEVLSYVSEERPNYSALHSEISEEEKGSVLFAYRQIVKEVLSRKDILTPLEKACFTRYLEGKPYGEIAQELDESVKFVDNALTRCRKKLKKFKSDYEQGLVE